MIISSDAQLSQIKEIVEADERISPAQGLYLFQHASVDFVGALAHQIRVKKHGMVTYYNKNFHLEPTNKCVFTCNFCSYSSEYKNKEEGWELTIDEMMHRVKKYDDQDVTEIHIVGGVHPKMNLDFFCELISKIHAHRPALHIKGFTAVELDYMIRKAKLTYHEGLKKLNQAGLQSLPGGGAEIFHADVRKIICEDKVDGKGWLEIHRTAHELGMHSNATMLYGHIESYEHRIDHMEQLRLTQDQTHGFNCFIPLKFRNKDNDMSHIEEVNLLEDLRVYSIARIYMDNFPHLKAYWPMIGRHSAQLMQSFGVNDLDGTIDDSTKIYSMAGSEEQNPAMSTQEITALISNSGFVPVERDTLYNPIV
jgi:aminodeoxyfutalosine synthase